MAEVILVVSGHPGARDRLLAAGRRLAELVGQGRVRMLALAPRAAEWGPDIPVRLLHGGADIAGEVAARGSRADFLVLARPANGDDRATREAFRTALLKSERPVLMLPPNGPADAFGRRVAVAWRDDPQTMKALIPALRLLGRAEEVHLLAGVREGRRCPSFRRCWWSTGLPPPCTCWQSARHRSAHRCCGRPASWAPIRW